MKAAKTTQTASVKAQSPRAASPFTPRPFHESQEIQPENENRTGLPDALKAGIENLSGISLDDVKVYYGSSRPAGLAALAYTQGNTIHVGPGQEKHLPHEAWHVVQQKQGRVVGMRQLKGQALNDSANLEHEADVMGAKALRQKDGNLQEPIASRSKNSPVQRMTATKGAPLTAAKPAVATPEASSQITSRPIHAFQDGLADTLKARILKNLPNKILPQKNVMKNTGEDGQVMQMRFSPEIEAVRDRGKVEVISALTKAGFSTENFNWVEFLNLSTSNFLYDNWATIAKDLQLAPVAAATEIVAPSSKSSVSRSAPAPKISVTTSASKASPPGSSRMPSPSSSTSSLSSAATTRSTKASPPDSPRMSPASSSTSSSSSVATTRSTMAPSPSSASSFSSAATTRSTMAPSPSSASSSSSVATTYAGARKLAENTDLGASPLFKHLGGGVNKQAYKIENSPWIVLAAPTSKRRVIEAEISQILKLREAKVHTPMLGVISESEAIFPVQVNGEERIAFLEESISGFEIPRAGTAFTEDEVKRFGEKVAETICSAANFDVAKTKLKAALESISSLRNKLETEDIPDFQVRLDEASGRILTLDPGDPLNSENAQGKHLRWLSLWEQVLKDDRYLSSLWNKKNPENKKKKGDWS